MPIYVYKCPLGHTTEFLKLKATEKEPTYCKHLTTRKQLNGQIETFECGLPLEKQIVPVAWKYTKGKNPLWPPPGPPSDPTPLPDEIVSEETLRRDRKKRKEDEK